VLPQPGDRIGAYPIVALIGAGATGSVYRARDTNLERDVAIKFLDADVATESAATTTWSPSSSTAARFEFSLVRKQIRKAALYNCSETGTVAWLGCAGDQSQGR
jgi:serine/threonine protein kinase